MKAQLQQRRLSTPISFQGNEVSQRISLRVATRVGAWTARFATRLAEEVRRFGLPQKSRIIDGFLLRGVRSGNSYQAQVLDPPSFVLFAGFAGFQAGALTLGYGAMAVGGRDDVQSPGTSAEHDAATASSFLILQVPSVPSGTEPVQLVFFPPVSQLGSLITAGYLAAPLLRTDFDVSFDPLDDMRFFTFAQDIVVGGGFTSIHDSGTSLNTAGGAVEGNAPVNYLSRNRYFISETFLSDGWRLHPRRQVPHTEYSAGIDPDYAGRIGPGILQYGLAAAPAVPAVDMVGIDSICVAARAFRQYIGTWYRSDPGPEYRPRFYDRYGYQGLLVSIGQQDRADYVEGSFADFTPVAEWIVTPEDLEPLLQPFPAETPFNEWGKPVLPGFGQFLIPHAAHSDGGFVVFSVYTTFRNQSGDDDPSPSNPDAGDVFAIAVTLSDRTTQAYGADWDCGASAGLFPGTTAGYFAQSWIVGACAYTHVDEQRAGCLVWEHRYGRKTAPPRGIGGQWVLYSSDGVATTRTVLDGDGAPLFAAIMQREPTQFSQLPFDEDEENTLAMLQDAGGGLLVTAGVVDAVPVVTDGVNIPAENIRCVVVDAIAGTTELRGVITTRNKSYTKCLVSVVQPYRAAEGGRPEVQPVLLASVTDHLIDARGDGGEVFLSVDGGATWRTYIAGVGAQGGAFFSGNKLWRFGTDRPLSTGGAS